MPTYRSITTSIISQHGIYSLPEYPPPAVPNDPFSTLPTLCDQERGLVSIYIPSYSSSQFWIRYSIAPPYPPKALYYFKLFLKGTCVVSWGCGEEDGYEGRTMFGLYESGDRWMGETGIERRVLCFGKGERAGEDTAVDHNDAMEIKIYRAKGRKRIKPRLDEFRDLVGGAENVKGSTSNALGSISLVSAGLLGEREPQRFYKYALLDPLDKPFATFHYYNRSWGQLAAMGLIPPPKSVPSAPPCEPADRAESPIGSQQTSSSNQTISSSSSSSTNTQDHAVIPRSTSATVSPPKWAIFAPKLGRYTSEESPKKGKRKVPAGPGNPSTRRAVTAPSLISLSSPHNPAVTQAKFASLIRRARTPSPPKPGSPSRIPKLTSRKSGSTRTATPSPTRRTATRIPTPSPTKQDKILGRSQTPPAVPEHTARDSEPDVPRSGSMGVLMTAVNSAMSRRRKNTMDRAVENSDSDPTSPLEATPKTDVDRIRQAEPDENIDEGESFVGATLKEAIEEIELFDALEEGPQSRAQFVLSGHSSKIRDVSENVANNDTAGKGDVSSSRSVSDTSSTKKRRWALWGPFKKDTGKAENRAEGSVREEHVGLEDRKEAGS